MRSNAEKACFFIVRDKLYYIWTTWTVQVTFRPCPCIVFEIYLLLELLWSPKSERCPLAFSLAFCFLSSFLPDCVNLNKTWRKVYCKFWKSCLSLSFWTAKILILNHVSGLIHLWSSNYLKPFFWQIWLFRVWTVYRQGIKDLFGW